MVLSTTFLSQVMIHRLLNVSLKQTESSPLGLQSLNFYTWKTEDQ